MVASWTGFVLGLWFVSQIDMSETNRVASTCENDDTLDDLRQHEFFGRDEALLELQESSGMKRMQTAEPGLDESSEANVLASEEEEEEEVEDIVEFHETKQHCHDHSECPNPVPEGFCATPWGQNYCPETCPGEVHPPEWCVGCAFAETHGCIDGWRPAPSCQLKFKYLNETHEGCIQGDDGSVGKTPWCSEDETYNGEYQNCVPCVEKENGGDGSDWEYVAKSFRCLTVAFVAGDRTAIRYMFANNGKKLDTKHWAASGGKWPATVGISAAVAARNLTFDTLACEVFADWWTKDPNDSRSRVRLRHLLSFTSGFVNLATTGIKGMTSFTHQPLAQKCLTKGFRTTYTPEACAQEIYNTADFKGEPGLFFDYNSYHLQIAMAMAVKKAGMPATAFFHKYLFEPAGMTNSYFLGDDNPFVAGGLMTTAYDYASFLGSHLAYHIVPQEVADVLETDVKSAGGVLNVSVPITFENYAMGSWKRGPCQTMRGALDNCLNRERGFYYVIAPRQRDYLPLRQAMQKTLPKTMTWLGLLDEKPNVLELGMHWIYNSVFEAMQAGEFKEVPPALREDFAAAQAEDWKEDERSHAQHWAEMGAPLLKGPRKGSQTMDVD